jgi:hypothetical protein
MPQKPSETEEEYFVRRDMERRKELAAKLQQETAKDEQERLKKLHWMRCPKDGHELATVRLRGVAVDSCAACGGLWLDAGELDTVVSNTDDSVLGKLRNIFRG